MTMLLIINIALKTPFNQEKKDYISDEKGIFKNREEISLMQQVETQSNK